MKIKISRPDGGHYVVDTTETAIAILMSDNERAEMGRICERGENTFLQVPLTLMQQKGLGWWQGWALDHWAGGIASGKNELRVLDRNHLLGNIR